MENYTIFDVMYPRFKITNDIRLIELFAGAGSQAMALRDLGVHFVHHIITEWEVNAIASYKAIHKGNDNTDYSQSFSKEQLINVLFSLGISNDGKKPMLKESIKRKNEKWLRDTYNNIKATNNLVDITKVKGKDLKIVDTKDNTYILTYSFPCQDLSLAGKMKGMKKGSGTRSGLLWEVERILDECEELPQVLLMENVPQVISDDNIKDFRLWQDFLESKGYTNYVKVINATQCDVAQNRERCFMVSILGEYNYKFPEPIPLSKKLSDYLEDEVDEKYYLSEKAVQGLLRAEQKDHKPTWLKTDSISPTIDTRVGAGCHYSPYIQENKVMQIGNISQGSTWDNPQTGRVYSINGCCPTLSTCQGGGQEPKIAIPVLTPDRVNKRQNGRRFKENEEPMFTITTQDRHGVMVREATKQGYAIAVPGDSINLEQPNSKTRRGRVEKGVAQTLTTSCNQATIDNMRIRKLTPRECWRVMSFSDEDYEKAARVNSDSQLYKQAGNSIAKFVLMRIFRSMIDERLIS
ncbi:DNA (cytosine-5-)-methyltransferase [Lachnotalea glycerini]|uniref:DNA (cytosine-5-)-methyltransferase n=1 Tax=Lachnotalea glycerini TaxID=1763509 RepID=A0A371JBS1_9FIRM|nr:DNA (cytosine-5-)-methyltransferase [Lachnotalea glycerini]RDY30173.1 DNA (cytosine-5-)-methyltransferase [Lachnotalea glycerini]